MGIAAIPRSIAHMGSNRFMKIPHNFAYQPLLICGLQILKHAPLLQHSPCSVGFDALIGRHISPLDLCIFVLVEEEELATFDHEIRMIVV